MRLRVHSVAILRLLKSAALIGCMAEGIFATRSPRSDFSSHEPFFLSPLCFSRKQSVCRTAVGLKARSPGEDSLRRGTRKWALLDIVLP